MIKLISFEILKKTKGKRNIMNLLVKGHKYHEIKVDNTNTIYA